MLDGKHAEAAMDADHAYNYWRKVFVDSSDGHFTKADFDRWFRNGSRLADDALWYLPTADDYTPGSKEHFDVRMRIAFMNMLEACARGSFGE